MDMMDQLLVIRVNCIKNSDLNKYFKKIIGQAIKDLFQFFPYSEQLFGQAIIMLF